MRQLAEIRSNRPPRSTAPHLVAVPDDAPDLLTLGRQRQLIWAFLLLGLAARTVRYLVCFPLWEDECFLVSNFIDQTYAELLRPLNYHQVAPLGFLGTELTMVKLFGFNEWALRLPAFLASLASLALFRHVAGRLLSGTALVLAIAIFSISYSGIRYSAEAKPYGIDCFVALGLLALAIEWRFTPSRLADRWWLGLTAAVPVAIAVSYPAVFVAGGIGIFLAAKIWGERRGADLRLNVRRSLGWAGVGPKKGSGARAASMPQEVSTGQSSRPLFRNTVGWAVYSAVLLASVVGMLAIAARAQSDAELGYMRNYWKDNLPDITAPWEVARWLVLTHTGDLLAIPLGGERGASTLTFLMVVVGIVALVRQRRRMLLVLCLAPPALNMLAALLGRFPYGGHVKFSQYLAPAICMLLGSGGAALAARALKEVPNGTRPPRVRGLRVALALLAIIPMGVVVRDFATPYKSLTDQRYRDFARWFWQSAEYSGEAVCLKTDLGLEFAPSTFHELGWSAMYLCNQRIYSPRHAAAMPPRWDRVSADWPLRCVQYRAEVYPYDQAAFDHWLRSMQDRYRLVSRDTYAFPVYEQKQRHLLCQDSVDIFKFVPRTDR